MTAYKRELPLVSVVIPNYNGAHLLPCCFESLRRQDYPRLEVIVVDNGSGDESESVCTKWGAKYIPLKMNKGLGVASNYGVEVAQGELILILNNDTRLELDCISRLVEAIVERWDETFAVDALQFNWEGNKIIHYRTVFQRIRRFRDLFSQIFWPLPPLRRTHIPCTTIAEIPWGCAAALMVRKDRFKALGGFDETFFLDFEDTDLCWRAWLRGWKTFFVPSAIVHHMWGGSDDVRLTSESKCPPDKIAPTSERRAMSHQKNYLRFAIKTFNPGSVFIIMLLKLFAIPLCMIAGKPRISKAIVKAMRATLTELPNILTERRAIARSSKYTSKWLVEKFWYEELSGSDIWPAAILQDTMSIRLEGKGTKCET